MARQSKTDFYGIERSREMTSGMLCGRRGRWNVRKCGLNEQCKNVNFCQYKDHFIIPKDILSFQSHFSIKKAISASKRPFQHSKGCFIIPKSFQHSKGHFRNQKAISAFQRLFHHSKGHFIKTHSKVIS